MKKYLKIALIALIIVLTSMLNVNAADITANLSATADKTEVKVGDTVTINLSATCETGIEGIDSTLEYDDTKLELKSVTVDSKFSNMSGTDDATKEYKVTVISNSAETLTSATFATLQFEVLDAAQVDEELTITLSGSEIGDSNDEWTTIDDKQVTLKVVEEAEEGDNNSGDNNQVGNNNNTAGDGSNQSTNTGKEDNTQADKEIDYAGLEDYAFIVIIAIALIAFISYKQYKNI